MTRQVRWFREALDDLKQQIAYIGVDNPRAARLVADHIRDTGIALGKMATGRPGRVTGTYEKTVGRLPYIIAYAIQSVHSREVITILRVIHTARDWPDDEWPEK
ncbi:type II toxin-antitoxin system RelE/ParE family toxin [Phyllobacterium sp. 628]|uniref:type II toxin-antitoxin system RelE/ParE family toxin n=1 Tax=Phyllobacterium sp. 628 TaxID=2718938 RepID=UPI0016626120|nr:type II toxin-antitoxin system RelE/ParE family toxin [Phyllobacterium sp. 628]QND51418.1 type II toxin-antitoxin system RelE/ParE family toxin [Phyllobacterium sp. 628]